MPANRQTPPPTSLGLIGDGDEIHLFEDIERAFDVKLDAEELSACQRVGDLHALLIKHLPQSEAASGGCAAALCFYRLRSTLQPLAPTVRLRPDTPLSVFGDISVRQFRKLIKAGGGLHPPSRYLTWLECLAVLLMVAAPVTAYQFGLHGWGSLLLALPFVALVRLAPVRLPPGIATLGDLARHMTHWNIGRLIRQGARLGEKEIWAALTTLISDHTSLPQTEIQPDMLLIRP